jgi:hypothetical protein
MMMSILRKGAVSSDFGVVGESAEKTVYEAMDRSRPRVDSDGRESTIC